MWHSAEQGYIENRWDSLCSFPTFLAVLLNGVEVPARFVRGGGDGKQRAKPVFDEKKLAPTAPESGNYTALLK